MRGLLVAGCPVEAAGAGDIVEVVLDRTSITEPRDVALYQEVFRRLSDTAATGADAAALTQRIAVELRRDARG